jgi:hypothetical protein
MKDMSHKIPNSARMGGSSGRVEKTVPLSAWYDPAVSLHYYPARPARARYAVL